MHQHFDEKVEAVAKENVLLQMADILRRSSILRNLYKEGKIGLTGGCSVVMVKEFFDVDYHEKQMSETLALEEIEV